MSETNSAPPQTQTSFPKLSLPAEMVPAPADTGQPLFECLGVGGMGEGLDVTDSTVLERGRQLRDGDKVEYVFRKTEKPTGSSKSDREK